MLYQNDNELSLDITGRIKVMVLAGSNTYNNPVQNKICSKPYTFKLDGVIIENECLNI